MTTPNLSDLIEMVRAARGPDRELDNELFKLSGEDFPSRYGDPAWIYCGGGLYKCSLQDRGGISVSVDMFRVPSVTDSLDAAMALCERVLPGWQINITIYAEGAEVCVGRRDELWHVAPTAPLALLAAILTTLQFQEDGRRG